MLREKREKKEKKPNASSFCSFLCIVPFRVQVSLSLFSSFPLSFPLCVVVVDLLVVVCQRRRFRGAVGRGCVVVSGRGGRGVAHRVRLHEPLVLLLRHDDLEGTDQVAIHRQNARSVVELAAVVGC